jgi:hypothetical protein
MFPGMPYVAVFPRLFPWADVSVDEEFYENYDSDDYDFECGVWDNEDGCYIMHTQTFEKWRSELMPIRPYEVSSGEVARFRLRLTLSDIGKSFLELDSYLSNGRLKHVRRLRGRFLGEYQYGLKFLAKQYGLE